MFSSSENPDHQIDRMAGCASLGLWVWKWLERLLVTLALYFLALLLYYIYLGYFGRHPIHGKAPLKDLQVALSHFKTEYGEFPIKADESKIIRTEGTILLNLLGEKTADNPRGIKFIDLPIARYGKYGLIHLDPEIQSIKPETALVDHWGEQYYLLIESTGDNRIPNPERLPEARGKATQRAPDVISASTIIFSSGPDKDPQTWDDNLCSWR